MIEFKDLQDGQEVWWKALVYSTSNFNIRFINSPSKWRIRKENNNIRLIDEYDNECWWWRCNFQSYMYGNRNFCFYETKSDAIEDWNFDINKYESELKSFTEKKLKRIEDLREN